MPLHDYPSWELRPRRLSLEEIANPMQVLRDFFMEAHLPEIREQLWEFLKTTVTGNYCEALKRRERSDLIHFYEKLEKLVEASHMLYKKDADQTGELS